MSLAILHKVTEDKPDRLVLQERTWGLIFLAGFFGFITLSLGFGATLALDSGHLFVGSAGSVLALLSLWASVAGLRAGLRPASRIVFDRRQHRICFEKAR